jgi:hypothetical protein
VLLGTVGLRFPGRKLEWNGPQMKIEGLPDADPYIRRTYRTGWEVEGL